MKNFTQRLRDIGTAIYEGGLFGSAAKGGNPFREQLKNLDLEHARRRLGRGFNLKNLDEKQIDEAAEELLRRDSLGPVDTLLDPSARLGLGRRFKNQLQSLGDSITRRNKGVSAEDVARQRLARNYDISKVAPEDLEAAVQSLARSQKALLPEEAQRNIISAGARRAAGFANDYLNPLTLAIGNKRWRTQALNDLYEGGLLGKGSTVQKAMDFSDFGKTVRGTVTPFLAGGLAWPAGSIGYRIVNPDDHPESLPKGISRDMGWYVGATAGLPFGAVGTTVGATVGENIGKYTGELADAALGTKKE